MKILLTLLFTLIPALSFACVSTIVSTKEYIEIGQGRKLSRVLYSDLQLGDDNIRSDDMKIRLQNSLDVRIPLTDLPNNDLDKTTDPARPDLFWDKGDLVGRGCVISAVTWDGQRHVVTIKRAR